MAETNAVLEIDRSDLRATRLVENELRPLADGEVRLAIERFALTANNVTYAAVGDLLGYWDFFPTGDPQWGRVPAMGWATVSDSKVDGVEVGSRLYGWYPMARFVDIAATSTDTGLRDDSAHRAQHAGVYRAFVDTRHDPWHRPGDDLEDRHALLRGLFLTGMLADEKFADDDYLGAASTVVLSASSKTAIGYAQRAATRGLDAVVGVTSARNVDFVESVGCYDEVVTYDDLESLPTSRTAVAIDMAGDQQVLARLHAHLGDRLLASMIVGRSHHDAPPAVGDIAGPTPEFFFAPTEVPRRQQEWGADEYRRRTTDTLDSFVDFSRKWMTIEQRRGPAAVEQAWADTVAGVIAPSTGLIVSLHA